ncbi:MAG: SDR family oxidoreductase [Labilithrix sp.]|nr:SDR family oxidoreductase [Labilithrix sp.]MCW5811780.1 SDR family oxidoreductase [Labilithrix sp.]
MKNGLRTWDGATVVITGAASGFGRAFAETLAKRGANLVLSDIQRAKLEDTVTAIEEAGGKARGVVLDVRDKGACADLVENAFALEGRLDYVFANAGIGVFGETHLLEDKEWDAVIDVNVWGVVHVVRPAYRKMVAQGFGHIVNTASLAGLVQSPFLAPYALTKHAVVGLSKTMRVEAASKGVRVSALCPGAVRTPILSESQLGGSIYDITAERMLAWWKRIGPIMELEDFTREALAAIEKNEGIIVLPRRNVGLHKLLSLLPQAAGEKIAQKIYEDSLRHFPELARGRAATIVRDATTARAPRAVQASESS